MDLIHLIEPARKVIRITKNLRSNNQNYKLLHAPKKKTSPSSSGDTKAPPAPKADKKSDEYWTNRRRQLAIHAAINQGTFDKNDFTDQVPPNACVYHGVVHKKLKDSTMECTYIKDLLESAAAASQLSPTKPTSSKPPPAQSKPLQPKAKTAKGPSNDEIDMEEISDALDTLLGLGNTLNNASDDDTSTRSDPHDNIKTTLKDYFHIFTKHVTLSMSTPKHYTVLDSGAYPMMFTSKTYFTSITP